MLQQLRCCLRDSAVHLSAGVKIFFARKLHYLDFKVSILSVPFQLRQPSLVLGQVYSHSPSFFMHYCFTEEWACYSPQEQVVGHFSLWRACWEHQRLYLVHQYLCSYSCLWLQIDQHLPRPGVLLASLCASKLHPPSLSASTLQPPRAPSPPYFPSSACRLPQFRSYVAPILRTFSLPPPLSCASFHDSSASTTCCLCGSPSTSSI